VQTPSVERFRILYHAEEIKVRSSRDIPTASHSTNSLYVRRQIKAEMRKRESGFDSNMRATVNESLPKYDALLDGNLRHFFEGEKIQGHLYHTGLIDRSGRVVDLDKHKSKLFIIDQEFKHAEKAEYWRQKEEEEMRKRVQVKRHQALETARMSDRLAKLKEDRKIRQEIVHATREAAGSTSVSKMVISSGGSAPKRLNNRGADGDSLDMILGR
jgi:hypothetical protein